MTYRPVDERYCSHCLDYRPRQGGAYLPIDKLHQQWFCLRCIALINQPLEEKK